MLEDDESQFSCELVSQQQKSRADEITERMAEFLPLTGSSSITLHKHTCTHTIDTMHTLLLHQHLHIDHIDSEKSKHVIFCTIHHYLKVK